MNKEITLAELTNRDYCMKGISRYKLTEGMCKKCNSVIEYLDVRKFLRSRKKHEDLKKDWNTCKKCWSRIAVYDNEEWLINNSEAQKISQNNPETKNKNRQGVSRSWTEKRKKKHRELMYDRWKSGVYKNANNGGHKGVYNGVVYESWSELAFIISCIENNIPIRRFDDEGITYKYNGRKKVYIPDFIINNDTAVEIKGPAPWYYKNYEQNQKKFEAAKKTLKRYAVIFDTDEFIKQNYNRARRIGHEIEKENI